MQIDTLLTIVNVEANNEKIEKNEKIKKKKERKKKDINDRKDSNKKINENDYEIPLFSQYKIFKNTNYPVSFLKTICKNYKLKVGGNKPELKDRIYDFLYNSNYITIIQKHIRGYLLRLDHRLRGPGFYKRSLYMNSTDFFTLENIEDVPNNAFYSIKTGDAIWGFNIVSIYNLFLKTNEHILNPYTREKFSYSIFNTLKRLVRLSQILGDPVNITLNKDENNISTKKRTELRCLELFQYIDELGNYTDSKWFLTLNRIQLVRFVRELLDIWEYRAQLDMKTKREICHPDGNPFRYISVGVINNLGFLQLQKSILSLIEQFVKKGINREACNLGASYILCGLTLVNNDAALALPWLYQSVSGIQ
jgi:hypothetical protein